MRAASPPSLVALAAIVTAAGGLIAADRLRERPAGETHVVLVACGVAPAPAPLAVALGGVFGSDAPVAVELGPLAVAGMAERVTIRFEPAGPDEEKTPRAAGGVVTVPVETGQLNRLDSVTLRCRYGQVAQVAYRHGDEITEHPVLPAGAGPDALVMSEPAG